MPEKDSACISTSCCELAKNAYKDGQPMKRGLRSCGGTCERVVLSMGRIMRFVVHTKKWSIRQDYLCKPQRYGANGASRAQPLRLAVYGHVIRHPANTQASWVRPRRGLPSFIGKSTQGSGNARKVVVEGHFSSSTDPEESHQKDPSMAMQQVHRLV